MLRLSLPKTAVVLLCMCSIVNRVSFADASESDNTAIAKDFFTKGERLFGDGEYLEAAAAFQRAYDLSPHPSVLVNIGYAYEYGNAHAKAVIIYREYLAMPNEKDAETVADVRSRLAMLALMVGKIYVRCEPKECTVEVDGVLKGKTKAGKLVVVMAPGKYLVTVRGDDGETATHEYRVEAGEKTNAPFSLDAVGSAMPKGTAPLSRAAISAEARGVETKKTTTSTIAFYALSGGALVSGAMIGVFGGLTLASKKDYKSSGYRDADARDATKRSKIMTNSAIGLASALAAGAVVVKLVEMRSHAGKKEISISLVPGAIRVKGRF